MIMEFLMKPGIKIKRWIFLGFIGMVLSVVGFIEIFSQVGESIAFKVLYLSGCIGCGNSNLCSSSWSVKEESSISSEIKKQ